MGSVHLFTLALVLAACGGQSTRRDRDGTGGEAGTISTGGTTGTPAGGSDSGGTTGVGGTQCSGDGCQPAHCVFQGLPYDVGDSFPSDDGCNTCTCTPQGVACTDLACPDSRCDILRVEYEAALERAKTCNPAQSSARCEYLYLSTLPCGCPTFANESPELDAYRAEWATLGCLQIPCPACDQPTDAYCSESGRCEDTGPAPRCDGGLVFPSRVCDYGLPCTDDGSCVHGDCYVPGSGDNAVCSSRCNTGNDCPMGTACIEVGGDGSHCFIRCISDEFCRSINAAPENPLACVSFGGAERVCIQESEP